MNTTYEQPNYAPLKFIGMILVVAAIAMMILVSITEANLGLDVNPNNFNQCIEEEILMCWENYEPTKKVDIGYEHGKYKLDVYNMVRDEWELVTTIDDIASAEEVASYLQARGFVVFWP